MQIAGIIAEYDPFHNGHAWQIEKARQMGAKTIIIALSSALTQRGGIPLLDEHVRAGVALCAGADLVLEMPAPCACSGAEHFAACGVALLAAAGCDTVICGTENASADAVCAAAEVLCSDHYAAALQQALLGARNFAGAREQAFATALAGKKQSGDAAGLQAVLQSPNNNLAVEYAKAILQQKTGMKLCTLPRVGTAHNAAKSAEQAGRQYASASLLRTLWRQGGADALAPYVPDFALAAYREAENAGCFFDPAAADRAVLSLLRSRMAEASQPFADIRGVSEGLDRALEKGVKTATSLNALCDALTTVRYPRARMRRLVMDAALHQTAVLQKLPPYLHILGAKRQALPLLEQRGLPASVSLTSLAAQSAQCAAFAAVQARAADLASLCHHMPEPMGKAFSTPCVLR